MSYIHGTSKQEVTDLQTRLTFLSIPDGVTALSVFNTHTIKQTQELQYYFSRSETAESFSSRILLPNLENEQQQE